jgi:hypothetical protein
MFILAPGDCSPSRSVVSKIRIFLAITSPLSSKCGGYAVAY